MGTLQAHEFADLFPMMSDDELRALAEDIRDNGQHQPIWKTEDGRILDGRNRLRACEIAGVEPRFKVFKGTDDEALKFVLSLNLTRRHLDESQRAMIAAKIAKLRQGEKPNPQICGSESKVTQAAAAAMFNTSERQVQKATKVRREASPETIQKVERGELSLNAAEKTIRPKTKDPKAERFRILDEVAKDLIAKGGGRDRGYFRDKAVDALDAAGLLPKSRQFGATAVFTDELIGKWLAKSRTFKNGADLGIEYRKGKEPQQSPVAVPAVDDEQAAFDALTNEAQEYLDSATKQVPESCRGQWLAFLQRIVEGLQS